MLNLFGKIAVTLSMISSLWVQSTIIIVVCSCVLKFAGLVSWAWYWILAPLWIPSILAAFLFAIYATVIAVTQRDSNHD